MTSSSWSRRTNPKIWGSDTTLTAYLPLSGCRIVQRNRCLPYHPVVGTTSGTSDIWQHWSNVRYLGYLTTLVECQINDNIGRMSLRCISLRWWPTSQLRRLWPWRMTLCIRKVRRQEEVCTLKLLTSMLSWIRTTVAGEWYGVYLCNTQTKLKCITIAQPHPSLPAMMIHVNPTNT